MPTQRSFTSRINMGAIREPASAVGAHLSAKLECFGTDERTLTDELCDMLCIWLGIQAQRDPVEVPSGFGAINITVAKMTTAQETVNGADLELVLRSPLGTKRCLIQAKVLDPQTVKLRCNSKVGWATLRKQLVAARKETADLTFLLVYVPGGLLNGRRYAYMTYEQGFMGDTSQRAESYLGATLIPVSALLGPSGRWRYKDKVRQSAPGVFVDGVALWRLLLELLLCRRSKWTDRQLKANSDGGVLVFRTLEIGAHENEPETWGVLQAESARWLPPA
jgi:hypothetical protein